MKQKRITRKTNRGRRRAKDSISNHRAKLINEQMEFLFFYACEHRVLK